MLQRTLGSKQSLASNAGTVAFGPRRVVSGGVSKWKSVLQPGATESIQKHQCLKAESGSLQVEKYGGEIIRLTPHVVVFFF